MYMHGIALLPDVLVQSKAYLEGVHSSASLLTTCLLLSFFGWRLVESKQAGCHHVDAWGCAYNERALVAEVP